ncbi:MAG TPA: Rrf2 family transcriptional regulator [Phycisphaerales bacterium]|nr:Rrf2 family transcriptional regulator [Phycisphaerales bacterium]
MLISQKCQYGLWAVFELAWRNSSEPAKIQTLAEAQGIPPRFLEVILSELKTGGFVESRRGKSGGYLLAREPSELTVGEIIRHVQGPVDIANGNGGNGHKKVQARGEHAFGALWENARVSVTQICDSTTFAQLVEEEKNRVQQYVPNYTI